MAGRSPLPSTPTPPDARSNPPPSQTPGTPPTPPPIVLVSRAGTSEVNGTYLLRPPSEIPASFAAVCRDQGWPVGSTWDRLGGGRTWYSHERQGNGSYMYLNSADGMWWLDEGSTGLGVYVAPGAKGGRGAGRPPTLGWRVLGEGKEPVPSVEVADGGTGRGA
ncbi:hypothetical protein DFJ74DRAFT_775090 [Hyaloraphidium curvatum]|nr:hypothetical protein DFJ74DRAFT_775090 [Hyaloraphidium curvatum]